MPATNPHTFFRFAAEHHTLLTELYYKRDGLPEAELLALIRRNSNIQSPNATYIRDRLVELGILEHSPLATAEFEMTRPIASLVGYLLQEYKLTSVEVIQSYFTAIDAYASDMAAAIDSDNSGMLVRVNSELEEHVERMRHDSRNNRERVVTEVTEIKTNRKRIPPRLRYEKINYLWTHYIVPLRDIIDTQKSMDAALDRLYTIYIDAGRQFRNDSAVQNIIEGGESRLRRLQRDVLTDFNETIREVTPLYEELRQETTIARGASHALERINNNGLNSLKLSRHMGICIWQQRGLFSDQTLESYVYSLHDYKPIPPPPLTQDSTYKPSFYIDTADFHNKVSESLPINDALSWLLNTYPDIPTHSILKLYGRLHSGSYGSLSFADKKRDYDANKLLLSAHPMSVRQTT